MVTKFDDANLFVYRGDREVYKFTVTEGGVAKDLTGATITCQGREDFDSATTLFDFSIIDGVDGSNFSTGLVVVVLPSVTTEILPDESRYDIQVVIGGEKFTIAKGKLLVTRDVTRP